MPSSHQTTTSARAPMYCRQQEPRCTGRGQPATAPSDLLRPRKFSSARRGNGVSSFLRRTPTSGVELALPGHGKPSATEADTRNASRRSAAAMENWMQRDSVVRRDAQQIRETGRRQRGTEKISMLPKVETAALVERGAALADRPEFASRDLLGLNAATISTSSYGPLWRLFRRNFVPEVAHPVLARGEDGGGGGAGVIVETFKYAMFCLLVSMCFGQRLGERAVRDIAAAQRDLLLYSSTKLRVFAFLPAVTTRLFGGRLDAMLDKRRRLRDVYMPLINARRERKKLGDTPPPEKEAAATTTLPHSYVDSLLDIRLTDDGGRALTDDEMVALCSEFLNGGTDTTSTALQWIMAELVKNPAIKDKLHDEIKATTGSDHVSEDDLQKMPYLKAEVLEGLRRHPPGHLVLPHAPAEDMELGGYVIPKGTTVNFMVADMGMDEQVWARPAEFAPERFLPGGDGERTDIGAGRRICPGLNVATLHLEYFVANLVRAFEWRAAEGKEVDVVGEKAEFTVVMAKPLRARLVPREVA
ncbi:hypothetical protein ACP70R_020685 [Stipagrostis hirtigluma subsp. patula]